MEYNKIIKDRVHKTGSSPRDIQRRQTTSSVNTDLVFDLIKQVSTLTSEINTIKQERSLVEPPAKVVYEPDTINEDARVKELTSELESMKLKLKALEEVVSYKDNVIEALKYIPNSTSSKFEQSPNIPKRPTISTKIIDPTVEPAYTESHIHIAAVKDTMETKSKEIMNNKLDSLRSIIGGIK